MMDHFYMEDSPEDSLDDSSLSCRPFLPSLRRLILHKTNSTFNSRFLHRLSPLRSIFLILRGRRRDHESPATGIVNLTLQSQELGSLLPLMSNVLVRLYDRMDRRDASFYAAAGDSLAMRCDFEVSNFPLDEIILLTRAQELWIDQGEDTLLSLPQDSDSSLLELYSHSQCAHDSLVQACCGSAVRRFTRLFCHGDACNGWLNGLTPNKEVSTPAPLLRELHILTPPPADPESQEKMAKMLEARRAAGIPLDTLCFYLLLTGFADYELTAWKEAFGQWGAWGARTPGRVVARGSLKVVFVCTETLPRMRVPAFCTEPSGGLWRWPTMWDAY